jgi:mRNA-degrading endonuclease toxin of MazEF toxin-antitoxin module
MRQWEIWKGKPVGFEREHWFVLLSAPELLNAQRQPQANGLACFTLRGEAASTEVRLNSAEGFAGATICQCDLIYVLTKSQLHSRLGEVSWERQQQIKSKLKAVLRL